MDGQGNLLIADSENHRIRRVDRDGIITTVAGTGQPGYSGDDGPATAAQLNGPYSIALGADGSLYIADYYNRRVRHPYPAGAEHLWRHDRLYDVIVVLAYNETPRVKGRGSAIFMHVAGPGMKPTEGCIALSREHLLRLIACACRGATITILP